MARQLAKSPFVLLALGLLILACPASLAEDDDPNALNQQVNQLIEQGKYQEAKTSQPGRRESPDCLAPSVEMMM